jgi:CubicO group peptidase (beta-lactamase class C family)
MKKYHLIIISLFLPVCLQAQNYATKDSTIDLTNTIDGYLTSAVNADKFNGVALVARNGRILFHKAYGWKNFESKTYNDTLTKFPILSITKSFTAILILKLQEQNKLSLTESVTKHLPEFPHGNKMTVEHLLTHNSGLYNYTDDIGEEDSALVNNPVHRQLILDIIYSKPLSYEPGSGFDYNNSGYFLAGLVIEKVTGKSYWQNVKEMIFEPLGMSQSGFDFNNLVESTRATGYQFLNSRQQKIYNYLDSTVGFSAGAIYSTTGDLYKWTQAIAIKGLLASETWQLAFTRKAGDYGIGFRINNFLGKNYIKHSGGYPGFVSEFIYYPDEDVTIIILKNSGNYGEDVWPITMGLSAIVFGKPYDLWMKRQEIKLSRDILDPLTGSYKSGELVIQFSVKENQLYMILANGIELPLLAESENRFYLQNFNTTLRFDKNEKQVFHSVTLHEHGAETRLLKQ